MHLASVLPAEIISSDSMQVYLGLDIGTAKPRTDERERVAHHLVDVFDIWEPYNAQKFAALAATIHRGVTARGKKTLLVGGTGLYAKTYLYDLQLLPADPELLRVLGEQAATPAGRRELLAEVAQASTGPLPPDVVHNVRRLLRACEVLRLTGRPPWEHHPTPPPTSRFAQVCLMPTMDVLRQRIPERTAAMLEQGWIEETRVLLEKGLLQTPTARQALGYRDIAAHIADPGGICQEQLYETLVSRTLAYARRQRTWFRNQHPGAYQIEIRDPQVTVESLVGHVLHAIDL